MEWVEESGWFVGGGRPLEEISGWMDTRWLLKVDISNITGKGKVIGVRRRVDGRRKGELEI